MSLKEKFGRREFLKLLGATAGAAALEGCFPKVNAATPSESETTSTKTPIPTRVPTKVESATPIVESVTPTVEAAPKSYSPGAFLYKCTYVYGDDGKVLPVELGQIGQPEEIDLNVEWGNDPAASDKNNKLLVDTFNSLSQVWTGIQQNEDYADAWSGMKLEASKLIYFASHLDEDGKQLVDIHVVMTVVDSFGVKHDMLVQRVNKEDGIVVGVNGQEASLNPDTGKYDFGGGKEVSDKGVGAYVFREMNYKIEPEGNGKAVLNASYTMREQVRPGAYANVVTKLYSTDLIADGAGNYASDRNTKYTYQVGTYTEEDTIPLQNTASGHVNAKISDEVIKEQVAKELLENGPVSTTFDGLFVEGGEYNDGKLGINPKYIIDRSGLERWCETVKEMERLGVLDTSKKVVLPELELWKDETKMGVNVIRMVDTRKGSAFKISCYSFTIMEDGGYTWVVGMVNSSVGRFSVMLDLEVYGKKAYPRIKRFFEGGQQEDTWRLIAGVNDEGKCRLTSGFLADSRCGYGIMHNQAIEATAQQIIDSSLDKTMISNTASLTPLIVDVEP